MRNLMQFERLHLVDSALMPLGAAEASLQKRLDQLPSQRWPDHLSAE
jgi:hypothetical protein